MKTFFISLFFSLFTSFAWGQSPTIPLPSSFMPPPPPNPAAIQSVGSLQFQAFVNNMLTPPLQIPPSFEANKVENTLPGPILVRGNSAQSSFLPKSFESSIQGLQFIKPNPTYSSGKTIPKKISDSNSVGTVSDQRLKRDIHQLTTMPDGIKLYTFKYLWSDEVYVGVMAQDLLSNPQWKDAVLNSNIGYYKVDYSKLGLQMMTLGKYELQQQQSNIAAAN
jgi:hypothetical protein